MQAPTDPISFPETRLDGRASYSLRGDIGDWTVTADSRTPDGWQVTVAASDPVAADTGEELLGAVMRMHVPVLDPSGPSIAHADDDGFVDLNGSEAPDGVVVAWADGDELGPGSWPLRQPWSEDLRLTMPFDTRAVRYSSTITFTASPGL